MPPVRRVVIAAATSLGLWVWWQAETPLEELVPTPDALEDEVSSLSHGPAIAVHGVELHHPADLSAFYERRDHRPAWVGSRTSVDAVADALASAAAEGVEPFHQDALRGLRGDGWSFSEAVALELLLTDALLATASTYVGLGPHAVDRRTLDPQLPGLPDPLAAVGEAADDDPAAALASLLPTSRDYVALRDHLPGASAEDRPAVVATLHRLRGLPRDLGDAHILVNIPEFRAELRSGGVTVLEMAAIVGREDRPTPRLSDRVRSVVLNPRWVVPPTILREDVLPSAREDPAFLADRGMRLLRGWGRDAEVVDAADVDFSDPRSTAGLRVEQAPGARNALGRLKLLFPNPLAVYAHDTPQRSLFEREVRTFSSGCVRLEDPFGLAAAVLGEDWDVERLREAQSSGRERSIPVRADIPVHLVYWTARVDQAGRLVLFDDVYALDGGGVTHAGS